MSDKKYEQQHHHKEHAKAPAEVKPGEQTEQEAKAAEPRNGEDKAAGPRNSEVKTAEPELPVDTVDDLKQQIEAQSDRYLRLMAEFDNFKKRVSRDYERLVESANERLMSELIEVRENLERAVKVGEQCGDAKTIFEGMKLIFTKFNDVCVKNGLEPFGAAGEPFDPQLHDALMKVPNDTVPDGHIAEVFEKGYNLKKRVIRHARVVVSSGAAAAPAPATEEKEEG